MVCDRTECVALGAENIALSNEIDELESENQELCDAIDTLKLNTHSNKSSKSSQEENLRWQEKSNQMEQQFKQEKKTWKKKEAEIDRLMEENANLQQEVEEKNSLLARETRTVKTAEASVEAQSKDRQSKREELMTVLHENEELRSELHLVKEALDKVSGVAMEYEKTIQGQAQQMLDVSDAASSTQREMRTLEKQIQELHDEKKQLEEHMVEMDKVEAATDARFQTNAATFEAERKGLQLLLEKEKSKVVQNEKTLQKLRNEDGFGQLEEQLSGLTELRRSDAKSIEKLKKQLEQREVDLENVLEDQVNIRGVVEKAIAEALEGEMVLRNDLKTELRSLKSRVKEQRAMLQEGEERLALTENELTEACLWKSKYEAGAGLEEAVRYQKTLLADVKRRDGDNMKLRNTLNAQIEANGKMHAIAKRLKRECGKPEAFEYDGMEIEESMKGEAAIAQGDIKRLEVQLDELEEERVRLLGTLRTQAKQMSVAAFKDFGLTPDQTLAVNDFIEEVKEGKSHTRNLPLSSHARELKVELDAVKLELVMAEARTEAYREQMQATALTSPVRVVAPAQPLQANASSVESSLLASLQEEIRVIKQAQMEQLSTQQTMSFSTANVSTSSTAKASTPRAASTPKPSTLNDLAASTEKASTPKVSNIQAASPRLSGLKIPTPRVQIPHVISPQSIPTSPAQEVWNISPEAIAAATAAAVTDALTNAQRTMMPLFESSSEIDEATQALEKLSICLETIAMKENEITKLNGCLTSYETILVQLQDQQTVLYREYADKMKGNENSTVELRKEVNTMREECEDWKMKAKSMENSTSLFSNDQEGDAMKHLMKQVARLQVNECRMARKYNLLVEEWKAEESKVGKVEIDCAEMEATLRSRLFYLETWKRSAENKVERLQKTVENRVPKSQMENLQLQLFFLKESQTVLVAANAQLTAKCALTTHLPKEIQKLKTEMELVRATVPRDVSKSLNAASMSQPDLLQEVSRVHGALQVATEQRRVLEERVQNIDTELQNLVDVNSALEKKGVVLQSDIRDFQEQITTWKKVYVNGGSTESETELLTGRIEELENMYEGQCNDVIKYQQIAELAVAQRQAIQTQKDISNIKTTSLQEQLLELRCETDPAARYGQVQQELIQLKTNYKAFALKFEVASSALRRKELIVRQLETKVDDRERALIETREEYQKKLETSEGALFQLQLNATGISSTGGSLDEFQTCKSHIETLSLALQEARKENNSILADLHKSRESKMDKSTPNAMRSLQQANAKIMDLRQDVQESDAMIQELKNQLLATTIPETTTTADVSLDLSQELETSQRLIATLNGQLVEKVTQCQTMELEVQSLTIQLENHTISQENYDTTSYANSDMQSVGKEMQEAAQMTLGSLKALLLEKNRTVTHLESKYGVMERAHAREKAAREAAVEQLTEQSYLENQDAIEKLRQATTGAVDEEGRGHRKTDTTQLLEQLQESHVLMAKQTEDLHEVEYQLKVARKEKETAEVRAGTALTERDALKKKLNRVESDFASWRNDTTMEDAVKNLRDDLKSKASKFNLLRSAVVKLKEEFIKAEERHAIELAKEETRVVEGAEDVQLAAREKIKMLSAKVSVLQEQLTDAKITLKKYSHHKSDRKESVKLTALQAQLDEVNDDRTRLREQVQRERHVVAPSSGSTSTSSTKQLEKRVRVLEAQNAALRDATAAVPNPKTLKPATDSNSKSHGHWEAEKRLNRRIEILSSRCDEKNGEIESLQAQVHQLKKNKSDRELQLLEQPTLSSSNDKQSSAETARAVNDLQQRVFDLENENAILRRTNGVDHAREIASLVMEKDRMSKQFSQMEKENLYSKDEGKANNRWKRECQRVMEENERVERQLLEKEQTVLQVRFDVEAAELETSRLQRRLIEVQSNSSRPVARPSTKPSRRADELEAVIVGLKRVVDKLKGENERLKAKGPSVMQHNETSKALKSMKSKMHDLEEENVQYKGQALGKASLAQKVVQLTESNVQLKRQLKKIKENGPEAAVVFPRENIDFDVREMEMEKMKRQIPTLQKRNASLLQDKARLEEQLSDTRHDTTPRDDQESETSAELDRVTAENVRLNKELSAFDLDFFEEVEDLKYKYAQVVAENEELLAQTTR